MSGYVKFILIWRITTQERFSMTHDNTINNRFLKLLSITLAIVFIWFGIIKYTAGGASGIEGLINNSPFMAWIYGVFSVKIFGALLGTLEVIIGILLLVGIKNLKFRALGSLAAIITFVVTLSFMITTPGIIPEGASFPILSGMPGEFLLKDIVLIAVSYTLFASAKSALGKTSS